MLIFFEYFVFPKIERDHLKNVTGQRYNFLSVSKWMHQFPKRQRIQKEDCPLNLRLDQEAAGSFPEDYNAAGTSTNIGIRKPTNIRNSIMTESETTLPYFGIQSDWPEALNTRGGSCWISVRKYGKEKSTHGELKCISSSGEPTEIAGNEPFFIIKELSKSRYLTVKDNDSQYQCSFIAAGAEFSEIHKTSVISLDVAEGGLGVSICKNNQLKIWETDTGIVRKTLQGHAIDAYTCRFFPSGVVLLSGGADCCLKIWSAETGDCPVTLSGHKGAVQDTCIVERGRNIISVSKDGTAKLWDCGESKCLSTLIACGAVINSCCLMSPTQFEVGTPIPNMSEREVLTKGKLLVLAREDAKVTGVSVGSRKEVFSCSLPSSVNRVIQIGPNSFAAGCHGGEIAIFDLRNLSQPQIFLPSVRTPILDMMIHPRSHTVRSVLGENVNSFWAGKSDGTCILINPNEDVSRKRLVQLTGPDSDAVYQIKSDLDYIYTACRDGIVRKYSVNIINRMLQ